MVKSVAIYFEIILFMAFLDIALTHFLFFLDRKKGMISNKQERNLIVRKLFMKQINPVSFLMGIIYVYSGLILSYIISVRFTSNYHEFVYMILGIYILMNYIHVINLNIRYLNWNNERFWKAYKELDDAEIVG